MCLTSRPIAQNRVSGVSSDKVTPIPIERLFGVKQWEFTVSEANLTRVDLRLLLGEEELLHIWHTDIGANEVNQIDVAIDFLDDLNVNKWRFYSAVEGKSGWFNQMIEVPEWAHSRNLRWGSMSSTPGARGDNRFQLVRMNYEDGKFKRSIPLYLQITLNGEPIPAGTTSTNWPPVVDPALTQPPQNLTSTIVADAFGYPGKLEMNEVTDWRKSRFLGTPLWAFTFSAEKNAFARVNVVGFLKGTFLTTEMKKGLVEALGKHNESMAKIIEDERQSIEATLDPEVQNSKKNALSEMQLNVTADVPIRIVDGVWGSKAYVQVMGFGTGGATYGFITASPDGKEDILITTSVLGEGQFLPTDTHEYYINLRDRPLDLLTSAGNRIASAIFGSKNDSTGISSGVE